MLNNLEFRFSHLDTHKISISNFTHWLTSNAILEVDHQGCLTSVSFVEVSYTNFLPESIMWELRDCQNVKRLGGTVLKDLFF